jgi:hypothetical protein
MRYTLIPKKQINGNSIGENVGLSLCYAAASSDSQYVIRPRVNEKIDGLESIVFFMGEKGVFIEGGNPKDFLDKQTLSYRYEVDKSTFSPVVGLDGKFMQEYESSENAHIINVDGPFSIKDMILPKEKGGWGIPVYMSKEHGNDVRQEMQSLIKENGGSKNKALEQIAETHPNWLICLNTDEETLNYIQNLDIEREKQEIRSKCKLDRFNSLYRLRGRHKETEDIRDLPEPSHDKIATLRGITPSRQEQQQPNNPGTLSQEVIQAYQEKKLLESKR